MKNLIFPLFFALSCIANAQTSSNFCSFDELVVKCSQLEKDSFYVDSPHNLFIKPNAYSFDVDSVPEKRICITIVEFDFFSEHGLELSAMPISERLITITETLDGGYRLFINKTGKDNTIRTSHAQGSWQEIALLVKKDLDAIMQADPVALEK